MTNIDIFKEKYHKKCHINNAKIIDIIFNIISQINSFNNKDLLGIENPPPQRIPSIKKIRIAIFCAQIK